MIIIEMGEYVSPYISSSQQFNKLLSFFNKTSKEGFADIANMFNNILTLDSSGTMFLKGLLTQEKARADSLMDTAKRMKPVMHKLAPIAQANDAAFESEKQAAIPNSGATLQGFALILLLVSYIALTIISTIAINIVTQNAYTAGKTFVGFLVLGVIMYSLLVRLA